MEIEEHKVLLMKYDETYSKNSDKYYLMELNDELLKQLEEEKSFKIFG